MADLRERLDPYQTNLTEKKSYPEQFNSVLLIPSFLFSNFISTPMIIQYHSQFSPPVLFKTQLEVEFIARATHAHVIVRRIALTSRLAPLSGEGPKSRRGICPGV
jgi:hypothetical protein